MNRTALAFSEQTHAGIEDGDTMASVRDRLGAPFYEFLLYGEASPCSAVRVERNLVTLTQPPGPCAERGIHRDTTREAVVRALGPPPDTCWAYSRPRNRGFYRVRAICFAGDLVADTVRRWTRE